MKYDEKMFAVPLLEMLGY